MTGMGVKTFLNRLFGARKAIESPVFGDKWPHYEAATGYYTVRGEGFDTAYVAWINTKALPQEQVRALGAQAFISNLDNRSGYVREFCLRSLAFLDDTAAFKPVLLRLNDYVSSNRYQALQLTLKWLAELPLEAIVDALPELESLKEQSRVSHGVVYDVLNPKLGTPEGQEALVSGLMHSRAAVRRVCWLRCVTTLTWLGAERIQFAMRSGDPAIARSVESDVYGLPDEALLEWFNKLHQVRAMPLRRAFLVVLRRKKLVEEQCLIALALWDDSFAIRWLARFWGKGVPELLLQHYLNVMNSDAGVRRKRYALEGLAQLKLPEALQTCQASLQDVSPIVRKAALIAACASDTTNQSIYVASALQDTDMIVVCAAFRQLVTLGLPLPTDAIAAAARARREEEAFFDYLLFWASKMYVWQSLHMASFTSQAAPDLQRQLAPRVGYFLNDLRVTEVYVAPTKEQWQAINAWPAMKALPPNSGLHFVMNIYAKRMDE
jgi:hypothetical protein